MTRTEAIAQLEAAIRLAAVGGATEQQVRRWQACIARLSGQPAATPEQQVRGAIAALAAEPGEWVSLTRLRAAVPHLTRDEQDAALKAIMRSPGGNLVPENNQKTLTDADWAAAMWIGGQWKHLVCIQQG